MKKVKQKKLGLIDGEVLIVGIDIAKRKHCAVAIKKDGFELSRPFFFLNSKEGFERFLQRIEHIRVMNGLKRIVFGFEPTGPYWKPLIHYLDERGKDVVVINPAHTRLSKGVRG